MKDKERVTVVTGANRGLGREVCRQMMELGYMVVLTARGADDAREAAEELGVDWVQLDVRDESSIERAEAVVEQKYGRVDVLVNNAGIALDGFNEEIARKTIDVNTRGPVAVTEAFLPLMPDDGIIVMVSSGSGELSKFSAERRRQFMDPELSREKVFELVDEFIDDVRRGTVSEHGWPRSAYSVSKAALNALTRVIDREIGVCGMKINAVCPGWVRTDMGGPSASRSVEKGAKSIVWAATLGEEGPSGGFFRDGERIDW